MKLLSEYVSDTDSKTSKVYLCEDGYINKVVVRDDLGNYFVSEFDSFQKADYYAENWIKKYE
jgi:hypothetical protein